LSLNQAEYLNLTQNTAPETVWRTDAPVRAANSEYPASGTAQVHVADAEETQ
jgi:hypothetical protein